MSDHDSGLSKVRRWPPARLPSLALALLVAGAGCETSRTVADRRPAITPVVAEPAEPDLDEQYLIGPTAARVLGYRIQWQTSAHSRSGLGFKQFEVQGDSVFTLDRENFLTRLRREDGERLWRLPVAAPLDEIHGITYLEHLGQIFLTTGGNLLVLDADSGSQVAKQRLEKFASTAPSVYGPFFIYGARNGQLVWHSYQVGYQWRAYQISTSIRVQPRLANGYVIAIGTDGRIMALDAETAGGIWDKRLLDAVVTDPAIGPGTVYVASADQHLWALDLTTGRNVWRYLTETPLVESPVLIGDRVYQQVPLEGLLCFQARPLDAPEGEVAWTAATVRGNAVGEHRNRLFVWSESSGEMIILDAGSGAVVEQVALPHVDRLYVTKRRSGDLYAAGDDGRVIRLNPLG